MPAFGLSDPRESHMVNSGVQPTAFALGGTLFLDLAGLSPSKAFIDHNLKRELEQDAPSCCLVLTLCDIRCVCHLKLLSFGLMCYTTYLVANISIKS